jgi:hypothetical protein
MPLILFAVSLVIYTSSALALLSPTRQPRLCNPSWFRSPTASVVAHAVPRAEGYEPSAAEWWRVHRVDRLDAFGASADVQNPLLLEDHIHPTYFVKDGEVSHSVGLAVSLSRTFKIELS